MREEWRQIADHPEYAVSNLGRVKRLVASAKGHPAGNVMKPWVTNVGYAIVTLAGPDGQKRKQISRLVCSAFHGQPPTPEHQAAHNDGNPGNNTSTNLRWATRTENMADCLVHGTRPVGARHGRTTKPDRTPRGEAHGHARLSEDSVKAIRAHPKRNGSGVLLAKKYNVSPALICRIRKHKAWSHI